MPPRSTGVSFCSVARACGPWMAICAYRSPANSTSASNWFCAADVLEILFLVGGVHAQEVVVVGHLVHQDVVHEAAVLVEQPGVVRLPGLELADGVGGDEIGEPSASGPRISISPMWLTSNSPTAVRTALCSSMMPEYWTGISQPPKSTILAFNARWTEFSGVVRRAGAADMKIQANSTQKGVSNSGPCPAQSCYRCSTPISCLSPPSRLD